MNIGERDLDTALKSVREAEALSQKMLERQRLLDEARREFQAALDAASERLAIIPVEQFIIQGIRAVPDAVVEARDAIYEAQKTLQGSDSAPIKEAVTNAQASVDKALARAESEALRLRAMTDLDECEKTLVQIGHEVREGGFEERIGDLLTHGEKLVQDARAASTLPTSLLWCERERRRRRRQSCWGAIGEGASSETGGRKSSVQQVVRKISTHGRGEQRPGRPEVR